MQYYICLDSSSHVSLDWDQEALQWCIYSKLLYVIALELSLESVDHSSDISLLVEYLHNHFHGKNSWMFFCFLAGAQGQTDSKTHTQTDRQTICITFASETHFADWIFRIFLGKSTGSWLIFDAWLNITQTEYFWLEWSWTGYDPFNFNPFALVAKNRLSHLRSTSNPWPKAKHHSQDKPRSTFSAHWIDRYRPLTTTP